MQTYLVHTRHPRGHMGIFNIAAHSAMAARAAGRQMRELPAAQFVALSDEDRRARIADRRWYANPELQSF